MKHSSVICLVPFGGFRKEDQKTKIKALEETIEIFRKDMEVVVVDDGTHISNIPGIVIQHPTNLGQSAAILSGLRYILEKTDAKYIIQCDGDKDQDPRDYKRFIELLRKKSKSAKRLLLIIGDRYTPKEFKISQYRQSILDLQQILFETLGSNVRDSVSGFRAYSRDLAKLFVDHCQPLGWSVNPEQVVVASLANAQIENMPLSYSRPRDTYTNASKLEDCVKAFLNHIAEIKEKGLSSLVNILTQVATNLKKRVPVFSINLESLGRKEKIEFQLLENDAYTAYSTKH